MTARRTSSKKLADEKKLDDAAMAQLVTYIKEFQASFKAN